MPDLRGAFSANRRKRELHAGGWLPLFAFRPENVSKQMHKGERQEAKPGEKRQRGRRNPVLRDTGFLDRYSYYPKTTILKSARIQTVPQKRKVRNLCLTFADDWADGWLFLYLVSQCTIESQNSQKKANNTVENNKENGKIYKSQSSVCLKVLCAI